MEPGQLCRVLGTFIEDRNGRALIRLPNGSKASVPYGSVLELPASGHLVAAQDGSNVEVYCSQDDWRGEAPDFNQAGALLIAHAEAHESSNRDPR